MGLALNKPERLDAAIQEELRRLAPQAMVVTAYGLLLPPAVLDIPRLGCINVHASLLPRWRGAAPIARAIEAGDPETGISIMQMDAGLDTGPVLAHARWPIPADATAAAAHDKLAEIGATLIVDTLAALAAGSGQAKPQPTDGACYARKLTKQEARLDWADSTAVLDRKVRAFNPAPVAWTTLDGERIRIRHARPDPTRAPDGTAPGTVLAAGSNGIGVTTGDGTLRLLEVQRPGGRSLPAAELVNGWDLVGRCFT